MSNIKDLKNILKQALKKDLPGFESQIKLAPKSRHNVRDIRKMNNAKKSAVLILLYPNNGEVYVPFIKRTEDGSMHSGQIAFPGGKYEKTDLNLSETALREAEEEVGVEKAYIEVLKELTPLFIPISNFFVQPVVGFSDTKPSFQIDKNEVEELYEVNLKELIKANIVNRKFTVRNTELTAPFYILENFEVWGATAMILSEFIDVIKNIKIT